MRFSGLATTALVAPLVAAHAGIPSLPKVFGLPQGLPTDSKVPLNVRTLRHPAESRRGLLAARQGGQNGRCGPSFGNARCDEGFCCSAAGYCGTGTEDCASPDCLADFGPACDSNQTPQGASTRNDPRPQKGNIPYGGGGVYACQNPGTVAITFDDGPYIYTAQVLDQFAEYGFKATFFITGNNLGKGAIDTTPQWSDIIRRMVAEGHQVASHTWSHQDLSVITNEQRYDQMVKNEIAIRNIIGKYPTYMRPPYSSCNAECQTVMKDLGYVISYFDLDTDDYNQLSNIQVAKDNFKRILDATDGGAIGGDRLAIAHDIHEQTALSLTRFMLQYLLSMGYRGVTMGECLGEPEENWYRTSGEARSPTNGNGGGSRSESVSTDGSCGSSQGSCAGSGFGDCCSQHGWCGSTETYCGAGCNSAFGKCSSAGTSVTPNSSSTRTSQASVSTDGKCGSQGGATCAGSTFGGCCSQFGWCGRDSEHCGTGCDKSAGTCE